MNKTRIVLNNYTIH